MSDRDVPIDGPRYGPRYGPGYDFISSSDDPIDYINNVLNRTSEPRRPDPRVDPISIGINEINDRLNRGLYTSSREIPSTGLTPPIIEEPPSREEPPTGVVPDSRASLILSNTRRMDDIDLVSTTPLADSRRSSTFGSRYNSRSQPTSTLRQNRGAISFEDPLSRLDAQLTSMEEKDNSLLAIRTHNSRGQLSPPNSGRSIQTSSTRRAPPIPQQAIQVDPIKEQLCVQLFGRSNNGCLELTMNQLETIQWAMDNRVYQRTGNETYQTMLPIAEHNGRIRSVIGCLLELANKYGNELNVRSMSKFAIVYFAVNRLISIPGGETPQTIYQRMLDTRQSISDEAFAAIPWTDAGFDTRASLIAKSINPPTGFDFLANFAPESFSARSSSQLGNNTELRKKLLEIYDCLISIMLQLYPQLGNRGGKLKRKYNKKSYKKRKTKGKRRKTKRKY